MVVLSLIVMLCRTIQNLCKSPRCEIIVVPAHDCARVVGLPGLVLALHVRGTLLYGVRQCTGPLQRFPGNILDLAVEDV